MSVAPRNIIFILTVEKRKVPSKLSQCDLVALAPLTLKKVSYARNACPTLVLMQFIIERLLGEQ